MRLTGKMDYRVDKPDRQIVDDCRLGLFDVDGIDIWRHFRGTRQPNIGISGAVKPLHELTCVVFSVLGGAI